MLTMQNANGGQFARTEPALRTVVSILIPPPVHTIPCYGIIYDDSLTSPIDWTVDTVHPTRKLPRCAR